MDLQSTYHKPVMLQECLEGLQINPEGTYVDVTFGGGGHSRAILQQLTTGRLLVFDQDPDAAANAAEFKDDKRFTFIASNFRHLKRYLKLHKAEKVNGILADLGVSSHQINTPERGFSTRFDADLDMRMNPNSEKTAREVINTRSAAELQRILGMYGEVMNAKTAAEALSIARHKSSIETVNDLKSILMKYAPKHRENKYFAQVFQALRIEVNDELSVLEEFLTQAPEVLDVGGRLVVMSYHSLEDRLVKNFIQKGKFYGEVEKDFYGNEIKPLKSITRKPVEASQEEVTENPRARSAKLRVAEKV
ncbi:16S rRNA (cytosine(1402)-N(4))-methyltransferase RsmH [Dyadobacter sp. CY323]|uniref:16S rRNA (cytosine(1402)-N(4))-methyltransferase RsmH n=1 Tax=Dyadobacter sp. CY323 TaxID=2907302 RepID=UPI001F3DCEB9|nr:16S rRNA (cytosine(1402)-N(4))-methyltransferase RsmH [Dyadobacter sp. CY323]MCE6988950.1 16S rRNA (cytosine(1402)-N(4))-methyltransferase RsmH [Dyadobacter sp. CY323]